MYGDGAVAPIVVPTTLTDEPTPLGQAAGFGKVPKFCAVEQLSFEGWENPTKDSKIKSLKNNNLIHGRICHKYGDISQLLKLFPKI